MESSSAMTTHVAILLHILVPEQSQWTLGGLDLLVKSNASPALVTYAIVASSFADSYYVNIC